MKILCPDKLTGPVTMSFACLLILTATSSLLLGPLTPFAAAKQSATNPVKVGTVSVGQQKEKALTNAKGFALYFYDDDKDPAKPDCNRVTNAGCTKAWPPLQFSGTLRAVTGLPAKSLVLAKNTNGSQVIFQNHPLYTYKSDKKALVATGNGVDGGKWHIALPSLQSAS